MIFKINCGICGKEFISNDNKYLETSKASVTKKLKEHIKNDHNISFQEYIDIVYYNGVRPKCKCGCGKDVTFTPKNALFDEEMHGYGKYFHCSHVWKSYDYKLRNHPNNYIAKFDDLVWLKQHYDEIYGWENIENSANDFLNKEFSNDDIEKKYSIDRRTLRKIWFKFGLVTQDQYKEIARKNQHERANKHRRIIFENSETVCEKLYNILKNFPLKYNINSLIKEYNENNIIQIDQDPSVILKYLLQYYGEEIYDLIQYGVHSKEEVEFINILKFYLGKANIKCGKKFKYGENERESYIYDICINDKILIEYDGGGYWHTEEVRETRDKDKEKYAIDNGYIFLRVSYEYSRDPNLILKLKNILKNI